MNKEHTLNHLREAKASHVKWVQRAKMLINGITVKEEAIPINSTECKFGLWFYHDGQKLNALSNNPLECMGTIEKLHFELHDIYLHIFNIYFNRPKKGFFSKMFKKNNDISPTEKRIAEEYYEKLEAVSHKLLNEINRLERRVLAVPQEKLTSLL